MSLLRLPLLCFLGPPRNIISLITLISPYNNSMKWVGLFSFLQVSKQGLARLTDLNKRQQVKI